MSSSTFFKEDTSEQTKQKVWFPSYIYNYHICIYVQSCLFRLFLNGTFEEFFKILGFTPRFVCTLLADFFLLLALPKGLTLLQYAIYISIAYVWTRFVLARGFKKQGSRSFMFVDLLGEFGWGVRVETSSASCQY